MAEGAEDMSVYTRLPVVIKEINGERLEVLFDGSTSRLNLAGGVLSI